MSRPCPICHGTGNTGLQAAGGPQLCGICKGTGRAGIPVRGATAAEPVRFVSVALRIRQIAAIDQVGRVWIAIRETETIFEGYNHNQQTVGGWVWELLPSPTDPDTTDAASGIDAEGL